MRILRVLPFVSLVLFMLASPGGAQVISDANVMGIYFDTDANLYDAPDMAAGGQINIYLMVTNPTGAQISAWETRVVWDQMGGGFYGSWTLANGGLNVGDLNDPMNLLFAVGTGADPIIATPATILATWSGYWAFGPGSCFYVTHYPGTQSFPDEQLPGYAVDEYTLVPCCIASGSEDLPVASFGAGCPGIVLAGCSSDYLSLTVGQLQQYDEAGQPELSVTQPVQVEGVVTAAAGVAVNDGFYLQDGTAGIRIVGTGANLAEGEQAIVQGTPDVRDGEIVVVADTVISQGTASPVIPDTRALSVITSSYTGIADLVQTRAIVRWSAPDSLGLFLGHAALTALAGPGSGLDLSAYRLGQVLDATGILTIREGRRVLIFRNEEDLTFYTLPYEQWVEIRQDAPDIGYLQNDDDGNLAATLTGAFDGFDAHDVPRDDTRLWFDIQGYHLDVDVKEPFDPTREVKQWVFTSTVTDNCSPPWSDDVELTFLTSVPPTTALLLTDETTGERVDLWRTEPPLTYRWHHEACVNQYQHFTLSLGRNLAADGFAVQITAAAGDAMDDDNVAGTLPGAIDGFDLSLDVPEPPTPPGGYVALWFDHPEWDVPYGHRYRTDYRALFDPALAQKEWLIKVVTDQSGPVTLAVVPDFMPSPYATVRLRDHQSGAILPVEDPGFTYQYMPNPDGVNYFSLLVGNPDVPATAPAQRELPSGWSLIGFPQAPSEGDTWQDLLLGQVGGYPYVYTYLGSSGYGMPTADETVPAGTGAWYVNNQDLSWSYPVYPALQGVTVPLAEGWNLLGDPFWFPASLDAVMVQHEGQSYGYAEAAALGLVSPHLQDYDPVSDTYVATDSLETWHGYWVAAYTPGVSLWFDYRNAVTSRLYRYDPFTDGDPEHNWRVTVALDGSGTAITFGQSESGSESFDPALELPAPPTSPLTAGRPRLVFERPDWDLPTGPDVLTDIRSPDKAAGLAWEAVILDPPAGTVTLRWDATELEGVGDLEIYLPTQNRVCCPSMAAHDHVTIPVPDSASLPLVFRTPDSTTGVDGLPAERTFLSAHPNPFNPRTEMRFGITREAHVAVDLYDLQGRRIRHLDGGWLTAGVHVLDWDGTDDGGQSVPSGLYFAVLRLEGQRTGQVVKLSLIR